MKYCLLCVLMVISGSFGNNPDGMTRKNITVGVLTLIVLTAIFLCIVFLIVFIIGKFNKHKKTTSTRGEHDKKDE